MVEVMDTPETSTNPPQTSTEVFINPDGSYKDGWKENLLPEELRNEKFYDSPFNSNVKELLKTAGNQAKMLGKKGVIIPNEKSNEFEVKEFRKAIGVPDKYDFKKPESLDIKDDELQKHLEELNKNNFTPKQLEVHMKFVNDLIKSKSTLSELEKQTKVQEINNNILKEENTNYETNSLYIDNAVRQFTQGCLKMKCWHYLVMMASLAILNTQN